MTAAGDRIGDWTLLAEIGRGGNAIVWRAAGPAGDVALKVLNSHHVDSEPYTRFRQEIAALRVLEANPGVLPVLDADLPEAPTRHRRAWIAMPIAEPIDRALTESGLPEIVESLRDVARTIAGLHGIGIAHRDLKPSNLYRFESRSVVGDFGLVSIPGGADLTGDRLGPANFLPYEMLINANDADATLADVYSFAKTLWVLATGQRWAPLGTQPAEDLAYSIAKYARHSGVRLLDTLVGRCTAFIPTSRPPMSEVAADLEAWLLPGAAGGSIDLVAAPLARLLRVGEAQISADEHQRRLVEIGRAHSEALVELLAPLESRLELGYPMASGNVRDALVTGSLRPAREIGSPGVLHEDIRATVVKASGGPYPLAVTVVRRLTVRADGTLEIKAQVTVSRLGMLGGPPLWEFDRTVPAESILATRAIDGLASEIENRLPDWLARLADEAEPP